MSITWEIDQDDEAVSQINNNDTDIDVIRIQTTMTSDKHHNSRGIKDQDFHLL